MDLTYAIDGIITYHAGLAVVSDGMIDGASNHSDSYEREWSSFPAAWTANVQSFAPECPLLRMKQRSPPPGTPIM